MNIKTFALASSILIAGSGLALAEEAPAPLWSQSTFWQVRIDPSMGGCFMQAEYHSPTATLVRFGIKHAASKADVGYLVLINPEWSSLVPGQGYAVQIKFDNVRNNGWATWTGFAHRMGDNQSMALEFDFNNLDLWDGVIFGSTFHLVYQGHSVIDGNLPGSAEAAAAMANCQKAYNVRAIGPADPFQGPAVRRDPFVGT